MAQRSYYAAGQREKNERRGLIATAQAALSLIFKSRQGRQRRRALVRPAQASSLRR
jgi:hypothetical protein